MSDQTPPEQTSPEQIPPQQTPLQPEREKGLAFNVTDQFSIGRSAGMRSAELLAAGRHDAMRTPLTRSLVRFSGQVVLSLIKSAARNVLPLVNYVPARTYLFKSMIDDRYGKAEGITVVEMASGFSTRSIEMALEHPTWTVIEVDIDDVIAEKEKRLRRAPGIKVPDNLKFIGADLGERPLLDVIGGEKVDVVTSEGLLMYFSRPAALDIARGVRTALKAGGAYYADMGWRANLQEQDSSAVLRSYERFVSSLKYLVNSGKEAEEFFVEAGYVDVRHEVPSARAEAMKLPTPVFDMGFVIESLVPAETTA